MTFKIETKSGYNWYITAQSEKVAVRTCLDYGFINSTDEITNVEIIKA
jgi:hypothetical protein